MTSSVDGELPSVPAQGFKRIAPKRGKGLRRKAPPPAWATVTKTGRTVLSVGATALAHAIARESKLDPEAFAVSLGVNENTGVITVEPVPVEAPDATPVRLDKAKGTLTIYLGDVFDDVPDLRPTVTHRSPVVDGRDPDMHRCLLITLQTAVTK